MKKILLSLMLLGSTAAVFGQIWPDGNIEYGNDRKDIPYRISPFSSSARDGAIWRPLKEYRYILTPEEPRYDFSYQYDTTGVLQQEKMKYCFNQLNSHIAVYNQTFTKEGFDFQDTITWYRQQSGTNHIPECRIYNDIHYFDRFPHDSFYCAEYTELWNDVTKQWIPYLKEHSGYADTTLFLLREWYRANYNNGEWVKYEGHRYLLEYDEEGVATSQIHQSVNSKTGEYENYEIREYFYDEDRVHIGTDIYVYLNNDWVLYGKVVDVKYTEWYKNGQTCFLRRTLNGPDSFFGLATKRVKLESYTELRINSNEEWVLFYKHHYVWDIGDTYTHADTLYRYHNNDWRLFTAKSMVYNERGDCIYRTYERFSLFDGELDFGTNDYFLTVYHPEYGECESFCYYEKNYNTATQSWDSVFMALWEYYDWWDVRYPVSITELESTTSAALSIFPNPVSGIATISASEEIQQLHIFDITGRLAHSQSPADKQVVFDTGALPSGVYLVRALMKDGGVQTGKLIITE